eukprot:1141614-Pelagomonas_calceolata.AAC.1
MGLMTLRQASSAVPLGGIGQQGSRRDGYFIRMGGRRRMGLMTLRQASSAVPWAPRQSGSWLLCI